MRTATLTPIRPGIVLPTPAPRERTDFEAFHRARKAEHIAKALRAVGITDARLLTDEAWFDAAEIAGRRMPSTETRAVVTAILDVEAGLLDERAQGSKDSQIAYYQARKAARLATVLREADADSIDTLSAWQWRAVRQLAGLDAAPSERVQEMVAGLLAP